MPKKSKARPEENKKGLKEIAEELHPFERKVLLGLEIKRSVAELCEATGLKEVEVVRGLQWLQNKSLVSLSEQVREVVVLLENGASYKDKGLPEKNLLLAIAEKPLPLSKAQKEAPAKS